MAFDGAKGRILVVDDLATNRNLLSRRFERAGFKVIEAESGPVALDLIAKQSFDVVLLDILMPEMDGIEVLKRIRASHSQVSLPVIMVTAKAENEDVVQALAQGANDYILKPVDFSIAFARVDAQLANKAVAAPRGRAVVKPSPMPGANQDPKGRPANMKGRETLAASHRQRAQDCMYLAEAAPEPEIRSHWLMLANGWTQLALHSEH
jgi:DNA-binding response OmpR family regulator